MYVFVDDSGDPGFKFGQGSSRYLVIACCVFESSLAVELAAQHVARVRRELNSNHDFELKFHKSRIQTKIRKKVNLTRKVIDSIRFRDSKDDSLIQLADLIAGAYRSIHEQKDQATIAFSRSLRVLESRANSEIYYLND